MLNHRDFLAGLSAERKAALTARSDLRGLRHLLGHVGGIALVGGLIAAGVPGWGLLLPVQGVLLVFLFTLEHEATHKTPFANEALNEWVGWACGVVLLLPFTRFRYFHLAHHRYTHDPARDPELQGGGKPDGWRAYLWHLSGLPFWWAMMREFAAQFAGRDTADFVPASARPRVETEARKMAPIYAGLATGFFVTPVLFWVWLLPLLLGQPFLRMYLLAEHGRCPYVADMFDNTRTTFTNRVVRFLAWNMPYHAEHHTLPNVPFHKLPELHLLTREHLRQTEHGYARFNCKYVSDF